MAHKKTEDADDRRARMPRSRCRESTFTHGRAERGTNLPPHVLGPPSAHAGARRSPRIAIRVHAHEDKPRPGKFAPTGKFGRLFGELTPPHASDDAFIAPGNAMVDPNPSPRATIPTSPQAPPTSVSSSITTSRSTQNPCRRRSSTPLSLRNSGRLIVLTKREARLAAKFARSLPCTAS